MTALLILIALGVGFILGMLVAPFWDWYYQRRSDRLRAEWQKRHPHRRTHLQRVTEADFARLVNERRR